MSNYVSVTTVAAAAYAAYTGDVRYLAYAALSATGDYLRGNTSIEGPKLSDLSLGTSQYGTHIPWGVGAPRLPGQVWWASEKQPVPHTEGGKGGPSAEVTNYTYEINLLIGLFDGETIGLSRIWANGKLVWTRRDGATDETLAASDGANLWTRLSYYNGTADQLPDPTYEAAVGVGNAPAYRNRSYVFIERLQLDGSGQLPQLHFEIVTHGDLGVAAVTAGPVQVMNASFPAGTAAAAGNSVFRVPIGLWTSSYSVNQVNVYDFDLLAGTVTQVGSYTSFNQLGGVATGNSDTPLLFQGGAASSGFTTYWAHIGLTGARIPFTFPEVMGGNVRFAWKGGDLVVGPRGATGVTGKLYRFSTAGGTYVASSSTGGYSPQSILILGERVYAADYHVKQVFVFDLATLDLVDTINRPSFGTPASDFQPVLFDLEGNLGMASGTLTGYWIHVWRGGEWVQLRAQDPEFALDADWHPSMGVVGGLLVGGRTDEVGGVPQYRTWRAPLTVTPGLVPLPTVVDAICQRAGMPSGTWDSSALASVQGVRTYVQGQVMSARAMLEQLSAARFVDVCTRDKLYFKTRGGSVVATLPWAELGAAADQSDGQPLALVWASALELPALLAVTYYNVNADQEQGTEYADTLMAGQAATAQVALAIGMTPTEAKNLADALQAESVAGLLSTRISLPLRYTRLDAGDVIATVDEDGRTYRWAIKRKREDRGVLSFECVRDDASVRTTAGVTDTTETISNTVTRYGDTTALALDMPLLRDQDDGPAWWVAARGKTTPWPGCDVYTSADDITYSLLVQVNESTVHGVTTTVLPAFTRGTWDESSSVTINVGPGTLSSYTRDAMALDISLGVWLIGDEVLRARTATAVSAGVYTLTGLQRGLRGTEWAMAGHVAGERAVLLQARGFRRIGLAANQLGRLQKLKAVTLGGFVSDVDPFDFTPGGRSLKPLAPANLRAIERAGQELRITWGRRSRLSTVFLSSQGVPLGETAEAYVLRIKNAGGGTMRTINATTPLVSYTRAQQLEDGVTRGDVLNLDVRQISEAVGEGYAATLVTAALAEGTPQISRITVGGTFEAGAQLRAKIGSSTFNYTTLSGDTDLEGVAAAFAAVIDASSTYSATVSGRKIDVTGPLGVAFSVAVSILAGDNTTGLTVDQAPATASDGTAYFAYEEASYAYVPDTGVVPGGSVGGFYKKVFYTVYQAGVRIAEVTYDIVTGGTYAELFAAMGEVVAEDPVLGPAGYACGPAPERGPTWCYALGPTGVAGLLIQVNITSPWGVNPPVVVDPGSASVASDLPKIVTAAFNGTATAGYRYRIKLAGTTYEYQAVGGDTMDDVADDLAAQIDALATYAATSTGVSATAGRVQITGPDTVDFSCTVSVAASSVTLSSSLIQSAQA